ncbi:Cys-tRNA(Pro) deacylase [Paenibacillus azoreducens]|uniref:Cys-tRNA(Pro)/Cys-tRNA(Cys) deacylase n=1 Tax=Paenibacillus azoreducens TaxID=116718 RepID=A0A919YN52_9BACL|nr:Cys-tRNA(Pro) deacylase [Paenibacillus azoreducens]GIO51277.1 Cys-tRNA(Pro)/Cys-tRNA(Cys) deacylase [Paenibacillus azoreducens]
MSKAKTNAMRILDQNHVSYEAITYETNDNKIDGVSVARKIGKDPGMVYKTLVVHGEKENIYVFVIPVETELNLKKAAKAAGEKKVDMLPVKDIQKWTGYIRGGCSPIGMKKKYPTFIDYSASSLERIIVSGGKIGVQIELSVQALKNVTDANFEEIIH